jgi:hypothetical protein
MAWKSLLKSYRYSNNDFTLAVVARLQAAISITYFSII